jgi:hypothetical protein
VALLQKKTDEQKAAEAAQKAADREAKARAKLKAAFFASPAGEARLAFQSGAQVFQYQADVKSTKAIVQALSKARPKETLASRLGRGPVATLNAVCNEGWELINGSFVFVETGTVSRNRALATGQQTAVAGTVIGYYLFRRCETNRLEMTDPWDVSDAEAVELADQVEG